MKYSKIIDSMKVIIIHKKIKRDTFVSLSGSSQSETAPSSKFFFFYMTHSLARHTDTLHLPLLERYILLYALLFFLPVPRSFHNFPFCLSFLPVGRLFLFIVLLHDHLAILPLLYYTSHKIAKRQEIVLP